MKTRLIATAVVASALVLGAQTSAFAYAPPIDPNTGAGGAAAPYSSGPTGEAPGTAATASLTGDLAAEQASITRASTYTNSSLVVDENGELNLVVNLPKDAPEGATYSLAVAAGDFSDVVSVSAASVPADGGPVTVPVAGGATSGGSALASTGVDATPYVWFGGGLLVLGAGLVSVLAFVRRSRSQV